MLFSTLYIWLMEVITIKRLTKRRHQILFLKRKVSRAELRSEVMPRKVKQAHFWRQFPRYCYHWAKDRNLLSSLSWHIVCLENRPQISEGPSQEIICSRGEASAGLLIQCVGNLWFGSILSLMTVTWTNQIWQKIISWPSFDLQILKTRIISMLGARLVNR